MSNDDKDRVARLKSNPQLTRGRAESASDGDTARGQVIQVATRCATLDEFVERFAAFAWESSLVLPATTALPVGTQGRFVILLRDQTVAMRGRCRVTEAKPTPLNTRNPAVKKVMMRVALLEMDDASRAVHKRLVALRSAPVPLPIPPEPSETTQIEPARHGGAAAVVAARDAAGTPPPAAAELSPRGPTTSPGVGAPPPAASVPVPPVKTPPPAPPVPLNRTMIGVGIGADGRAILRRPTPPAVPPLMADPPAPAPAAPAPAAAPAAAAQSLGTAATIIATVPPTARAETRAPRAAETLPANPLSEFDAGEVDSFIECTLLEADHAPAADAPDGPTSADAPLAVAAAAVRRTTAYVRIQKLAAKLPPGVQNKLLRVGPYVGVALATLIVGYFLFHRSSAMPPPAPAVARAPRVAAPPVPAPEPEAKVPAAEVPPPAEASAPAKKIAAAEKPAPGKRNAAPAPKSEPDEAPAPEPEKNAAPAAARPTVSVGTPGVCTARVVTEPKDAKVIWGEKTIGRSPIDGARVPCGATKVTIERERWQPVTVDVDMQAGDEAVVHQRLHRPPGTLAISSSPPGAHIVVNRAAVGAAPKHLEAMRYEHVTIKASLKGYKPWSKNVYLRDAETAIDIQLVPKK